MCSSFISLQVTYRSNNGSTRCFYSAGWLIKRGKLNSVVDGTVITDRRHSGLPREIHRLFTFFTNPNYSTSWQQCVVETTENYNLHLKAFKRCFLSQKFDLNLSFFRSETTVVYKVTFSFRKRSPCASHIVHWATGTVRWHTWHCTNMWHCTNTRHYKCVTLHKYVTLQICDTIETRGIVQTCDTVQTRDTLQMWNCTNMWHCANTWYSTNMWHFTNTWHCTNTWYSTNMWHCKTCDTYKYVTMYKHVTPTNMWHCTNMWHYKCDTVQICGTVKTRDTLQMWHCANMWHCTNKPDSFFIISFSKCVSCYVM